MSLKLTRSKDATSSKKRQRSEVSQETFGSANVSPRRSTRERTCVERYMPQLHTPRPPKYHIVPRNDWDWLVRKLGISARNALEWRDGAPLPVPPADGGGCWLLPCKCTTAVEIAKSQRKLAALGWKLLTCAPSVVLRIGQKANLYKYARELGLLQHLPTHWSIPEAAVYPCILKASVGDHGRDVFIVHSAAEAHEKAIGGGFGTKWLLQELCTGRIEHATSLLVQGGKILDAICTDYVYDREEYVWPFVEEDSDCRQSHSDIPARHLQAMAAFLTDFSGILNFNYKVRPNGGLCIFEINARIGADLACDVPRRRAGQLFAKLEALTPSLPPGE